MKSDCMGMTSITEAFRVWMIALHGFMILGYL